MTAQSADAQKKEKRMAKANTPDIVAESLGLEPYRAAAPSVGVPLSDEWEALEHERNNSMNLRQQVDDLLTAARALLAEVDLKHDSKDAPLRYTVPWTALTALRKVVDESARAVPGAHVTQSLVMADGTPLLDYLNIPADDPQTDEWTKGYHQALRRLYKILAPQLTAASLEKK